MTKKLLPLALLLGSFTLADGPWFSGKIVYHNTYKTTTGQDLSAQLGPVMGLDDPYYISGNNYKMYTESKQLVQLYTGRDNQFQMFVNGQAMPIDAGSGKPGAVVKPLAETATIAGYPCQSLQIDNAEAGTSTVYFYSPKLRVDPEAFNKHSLGDFYAYLKAAKGALPLRTVLTSSKQGFVMTSEATSVQPMTLTAADFVVGAPAR